MSLSGIKVEMKMTFQSLIAIFLVFQGVEALKVTWDFQDPLSAVPELLALNRTSQIPLGGAIAGLSSYTDGPAPKFSLATMLHCLEDLNEMDQVLDLMHLFSECAEGECEPSKILAKLGDMLLKGGSCIDDAAFGIIVGQKYKKPTCKVPTPRSPKSWDLTNTNCRSQLTGGDYCTALEGEKYVDKATLLAGRAKQGIPEFTDTLTGATASGADLSGFQQVWSDVDKHAVCNSGCGPDTRFGAGVGTLWQWMNFALGYPNEDILADNQCIGFDCTKIGPDGYTSDQTLKWSYAPKGFADDFPEGWYFISGPGLFGFNSYNDVRDETYYRGEKKCMMAVFDGYGKWNKFSVSGNGVKWLQRFQVSMFNEWSFAQCAMVPQLYLGDIGPPICVTPGFLANVGKVNDDSNWVNNMPWFRPVPGFDRQTSADDDGHAVADMGFGIVALTDSPDLVIMKKEDLSSWILNYEWYTKTKMDGKTPVISFNRVPDLNPCAFQKYKNNGIFEQCQHFRAGKPHMLLPILLPGWSKLGKVSQGEICNIVLMVAAVECDGIISLPAWVAAIGGAAHPRLIPSNLPPGLGDDMFMLKKKSSKKKKKNGYGYYYDYYGYYYDSGPKPRNQRSIYVMMMTGVDIPMKLHMGEHPSLKNIMDIITMIPAYIDFFRVNVMDKDYQPLLWCRIAPENLAFKGRYLHSFPMTGTDVIPIFNMETSIPSQDMLDPNFAVFKYFLPLWDGMWTLPSVTDQPGFDGVAYCDITAWGWQNDTLEYYYNDNTKWETRKGTRPFYHSHVANAYTCPKGDKSRCNPGDIVSVFSAAPGIIYGDINNGLLTQPVFNIAVLANGTARQAAPPVGGGTFIIETHIMTGSPELITLEDVVYKPNAVFNISTTSPIMQALRNQTVKQVYANPPVMNGKERLAGHAGLKLKYLLRQPATKTTWVPPPPEFDIKSGKVKYGGPVVDGSTPVSACFEFNKVNPLWNGVPFCHFTNMGWYYDGWYDNDVKGLGQFSDGGLFLVNRCNTYDYGAFKDREYGWPQCFADFEPSEFTDWYLGSGESPDGEDADYGCLAFDDLPVEFDAKSNTCNGEKYYADGKGPDMNVCKYASRTHRNAWHVARDRYHWGKQMHVANEPTWIPKTEVLADFASAGLTSILDKETEAFIIMTTLNRCSGKTRIVPEGFTWEAFNGDGGCPREVAKGEVVIMSAKNLHQVASATMPVAFTLFLHGQYYPDWSAWGNLNTMVG